MFSVAGIAATRSSSSPSSAIAADRLEHRGAAGHVHLHLVHARGGLDRDPAAVERDRLADQADARTRAAARVAQGDQPRLGRAALRRRRSARPSRRRRSRRGRGPRPRRASWAAAISLGALGERLRGELVRRQVLQRRGRGWPPRRRPARSAPRPRPARGRSSVGDQHQALEPRRGRVVAIAGAVAVEAVGGEDRALDQGGGALGRADAAGSTQAIEARLELRGALGGQRRDDPQPLGVGIVAGPEPDDEHPRGPLRVDQRRAS